MIHGDHDELNVTAWLQAKYTQQAREGCSNSSCKNKWCRRSGGVACSTDDEASEWVRSLVAQGVAESPPGYYLCVSSNFKTFPIEPPALSVPASATRAAPSATTTIGKASSAAAKKKTGKDRVAGAFF
jgi:hypothetical protein